MPRGILGAIAASTVLYIAVATAAVLADSTIGNPLLALFEGANASVFAAVGSIAVANGVLVCDELHLKPRYASPQATMLGMMSCQ